MDSSLKVLCIFLFVSIGFCSRPLELRFVCDSYHECLDEKAQLVEMYDQKHQKFDQKCAQKMKNDFDGIEKYEELIKSETKICIETDIKERNQSTIESKDKNRFCASYLFNRPDTKGEFPLRLARLQNRCDALRRCCEPAVRCEQQAVYSENGRTLSGLKEEVDIKMAECAQHEEEIRPHQPPQVPDKSKKQRKIKAIQSPPFSLCLKYLQCQKDAHQMRVDCSKSSNHHSIDGLDTDDSSDSTWQNCKTSLEEDYYLMNQRREEAFAYLDKCVPIANVTREFLITERVCRASTLKNNKPRREEVNCHFAVSRKRKECALLRDCCVQADVCERSALYAVISDEYLLRRTQLRETLGACLSQGIDEKNLVA
uniref:CPG4 domain-containing protein n=1 Tax=Caenorhabditis tropicalis TaxID=1561998 RepID=A0A1I7T488_9PELO